MKKNRWWAGLFFATMTFYAFCILSPVVQLYWVYQHGTFLANRWEDEGGVNLYHCADEGRGFFVEVSVADEALVLRSFVSAGPLEDYSYGVRLPDEWA